MLHDVDAVITPLLSLLLQVALSHRKAVTSMAAGAAAVMAAAAAAGGGAAGTAGLAGRRGIPGAPWALLGMRPSDMGIPARLNEALMALGDHNLRGYSAAQAGRAARAGALAAQQAAPPPEFVPDEAVVASMGEMGFVRGQTLQAMRATRSNQSEALVEVSTALYCC